MGTRRGISAAALAVAALALGAGGAAPAAAYVSLTPNQHDFGAQQVGTVSAPFSFTLRVRCIEDPANPGSGICLMGSEPFTPNVSVTGPFKVQNNTCTSTMPGDTTYGTTCTFGISFAPTLSGSQSGIVDSGDPGGFGKAAVQGVGQPAVSTAAGKKKCKKKKRSATAARKKCKKKKRG